MRLACLSWLRPSTLNSQPSTSLMPDVFTKAKRSEVMSRIRSRGNKDTELALAKLLRRNRITGWRRQVKLIVRRRRGNEAHSSKAKGRTWEQKSDRDSFRLHKATARQAHRLLRVKPDFVFRQARLALFVDGCFWHGCPKHATQPKNNRAFWRRKLAANKLRDRLVNQTLRRAGWRVMRNWECALRRATKHENEVRRVRQIQRGLFQPRNKRTTRKRPD